jgi:hypothetical protein
MSNEAKLWTKLGDCTVTFTDGSVTPIVYTFRVSEQGIEESVKIRRDVVKATDTDGTVVSVRKSGTIKDLPYVMLSNVRVHSHSIGTTAISNASGSLIALVRGTGPSGWTNTDEDRQPDHITGTLEIQVANRGTAKGETRTYANARIVSEEVTEQTATDGKIIPSLKFEAIDEPTIVVNS